MSTIVDASLLDIATSAAKRAGGHAMRSFTSRVPTTEKSGFHDLVTAVDREAEEIVVEEIVRRCPDSTVIAEEGGRHGSGAVRWYVDPIDGTNNFARGVPFFCVSIAAAIDDVLVAAAIYDPVRRELMTASDDGAFINGIAIAAHGVRTDREALLITDFPHPARAPQRPEYDRYAELIASFGTVRRLGSCALGLAYVACGRADATLGTNANPWDNAAGALIVQRAGGQYHVPASFTGVWWMSPQFVAACREFDVARSRLSAFLV
ncbi:MAG TPA: inositol monophosphatase family protein [Candidatus Limnocylindria bacterium]|jgi:myo-inositol-1(or 4)-monophosphatase|nr:inositol monophosphatase family protein [Candidatus Limnocylindria bacterium]